MRHTVILMLLVALAALFLSACAGNVQNTAKVDITMSKSHLAKADSMSGKMSLDDWIDTSIRQEQNVVAITLWRIAQAEVANGNLKKAKEYISLAQEVSVNNLYTKAKLINASDYQVTVLDGPFAGRVLASGASTSEEKVPIGTLSFSAISTTSNGRDMTVTIVRPVTAGQKTIVIVNKKY
ncbi:MAG TPA: hypothetical protein PKN62_02405 [bacterium]|nr:hypothetical protein [bacterium]